jgi:hypothetical protein
MIYQTGHFTCLENRTSALAKNSAARHLRHSGGLLFARMGFSASHLLLEKCDGLGTRGTKVSHGL